MEPAQPLRDVFGDLAARPAEQGGQAEVLAAYGHPGLDAPLVAEAVVSYADTAPFEVAEHLAAFVRANSPVPLADASIAESPDWLSLVRTAPQVTDGLDQVEASIATAPVLDLDFGRGDGGTHSDIGEGGYEAIAPVELSFELPEVPAPADAGRGLDLEELADLPDGLAHDEPDGLDEL